MRKICVVTGTRAEYGLLSRLIRMIDESEKTQLQLLATNMHLSPTYGETYKEIEADGFKIDRKIPIIEEGKNDAVATLKSMAKAVAGFADAFNELKPDIVALLGDRYEILAAAEAALIEKIPIAHIHGGEVTEGAYDDAIRHSITKMSHLHFPSIEPYRKRIIQMGENPERVFTVGAIGVENIKRIPLLSKTEAEHSIGFALDQNTILVTYHPVTLGPDSMRRDIDDFMSVLDDNKDLRIIFTMPNSDNGSEVIVEAINEFVCKNIERAVAFKSLGLKRYLSVMKEVGAVVGNSSSGIVEVPSFGVPTLNIGDRQKGRLAAESVVNCGTDKASIQEGLNKVLSTDFQFFCKTVENPYGKENTVEEIFKVISSYPLENIIQKHFYDL